MKFNLYFIPLTYVNEKGKRHRLRQTNIIGKKKVILDFFWGMKSDELVLVAVYIFKMV